MEGYPGVWRRKPPKLTSEQTQQLKGKLKQGSWLAQEVRALVKKDFGIIYSLRHISRILKGLA